MSYQKVKTSLDQKPLPRDCSWKQCNTKSLQIRVCICECGVGKQAVKHYKRWQMISKGMCLPRICKGMCMSARVWLLCRCLQPVLRFPRVRAWLPGMSTVFRSNFYYLLLLLWHNNRVLRANRQASLTTATSNYTESVVGLSWFISDKIKSFLGKSFKNKLGKHFIFNAMAQQWNKCWVWH